MLLRVLLRMLKRLGTALVALLILFEEWGWEPLARQLAKLGRLPFFAWLERRISSLPPYAALVVFFVPAVALLPVKVAALWLIGHGQAMLGLVVIVLAKLIGTAVVARLFILTRDSLMQLAWFERGYRRWIAWKEAVLAQVRTSALWRAGRRLKTVLRRRLRRFREALRRA
ncbi:MAG TPA: hypothetical protein VFP68_19745 [Burkholderiaceae bacterium]|nr:hypothetical protein [Burkholderiaceae bacterium]